jgi:uncharacterized protein
MKLTREQLKKIEDFAIEQNSEREWIHTRQIRPIAAELAKKEGADKEVVDVAILFHDIGKGKKGSGDHAVKSEKIAREFIVKNFLEKEGIDKSFTEKVFNAIKRHAGPWRGHPEMLETIEDKVVFDADMIQQRGPFGIAKQFDDFKDVEGFVERVEKVRDQLRKAADLVTTRSGKEMLKERLEYVEGFFEEVLK